MDTFLEAGQLGEVAGTLRWIAGLLASADHPAAAARLLLPVAPNPPLLAALEREYLAGALAGIDPAGALELRIAVADARTALDLLTSESVASGEQASVGGPTVAPATDSQDGAETGATAARWVKEGPVWALTFDGRTVRLPHAKGVADLAELVHRPGVEISAAELMGAVVESADLGPTIDAEARRAYERRIIELQEQLDEAESFGDLRRAEVAREELDRIVDVLMAATGLGGRDRRVGDSSERARSAVTRRIKDSIRRIGEVHPQLGDHLAASVRTGRWCAYEPSEPLGWTVER